MRGTALTLSLAVTEPDAGGDQQQEGHTGSGCKNTRKNIAIPGVERVSAPGLY